MGIPDSNEEILMASMEAFVHEWRETWSGTSSHISLAMRDICDVWVGVRDAIESEGCGWDKHLPHREKQGPQVH